MSKCLFGLGLERETAINFLKGGIMHQTLQPKKLTAFPTFIPASTKEYLAVVCHEIGSPLTTIIGLSQILTNRECNQQKKEEYNRMLRNSTDRLLHLMKNLLDSNKISSGNMDIEYGVFDAPQFIQKIIDSVALRAEEKGLFMAVCWQKDLPNQWWGDGLRISQVLLNIIDNAIKFTIKGHVALYVETAENIDGKQQICFRIEDTGMGMKPDELEHIFTQYHQAGVGTGRRFGGYGLGLAISYHLATLMHGNITVQSWPGCGTQFLVTLPLLENNSNEVACR
ncbi:MAG: sensor histidine kinase [Alphaproteobacteria bacterium]